MNRLVFLNDDWVSVSIPKGCDPTWTDADYFYYASCWVLATSKGFSLLRATQLAEALVSKRLYPGLQFEKSFEKDLNSLVNPD